MGSILMGQIYLKRMPKSIYKPVEEDLYSLEIVSDNTYSEESKPEIDYGSIDGCLSFWQAYGEMGTYDMIEAGLILNSRLTIHYDSKERMDKDFISLTEYLGRAKFIGRRWRVPGNDENTKFINSLGERTVLYELDNIMLVQNNHSQLGPIFELMLRDPESIEQEKFLGEVNEAAEEYKDKANTYRKVLKFISKSKTREL